MPRPMIVIDSSLLLETPVSSSRLSSPSATFLKKILGQVRWDKVPLIKEHSNDTVFAHHLLSLGFPEIASFLTNVMIGLDSGR